jgi:hypothetical protein
MGKLQQGRGGMGSHKHGVSGHATKSPRFRNWMQREAEKANIKRVRITKPANSVRELLKGK